MKPHPPAPSLLSELESLSRTLELSDTEFSEWMADCTQWGRTFLGSLTNAELLRKPTAQKWGNLSDEPCERGVLLDYLFREVLGDGFNAASPHFMGFVPGGGLPTAAIGDFLGALSNRYAGSYGACPGGVELENDLIRAMIGWMNLPKTAWGTLLSGGTLSTLTAVVTARETLAPSDWPRAVFYSTDQTHHCFEKALKIAGLHHCAHRKIKTDENLRMERAAIEVAIQADRRRGLIPFFLCANAGTTNTGTIDPLESLAELCKAERLWFHVDAAYGGFFNLVESAQAKLRGVELADSIVLDPHKGLFLPYGCGAVLVREASLLKKAFGHKAPYLADIETAHPSPDDYSPELTRHFRSLRLWLSLKSRGLKAFRAALEEKLLLAQLAYELLSHHPSLVLWERPVLSCVVFRGHGDDQTKRLLDRIGRSGKLYLSSTEFGGRLWIRMCILNFRTHRGEVERAAAVIHKELSEICR